jgi:hypothetical protein
MRLDQAGERDGVATRPIMQSEGRNHECERNGRARAESMPAKSSGGLLHRELRNAPCAIDAPLEKTQWRRQCAIGFSLGASQ